MLRRTSVPVLIAGAVLAAFATTGVFWAFGDDGPHLGGPVVVTAEPSEAKPDPSASPARQDRGDKVGPPPPRQGGDDDDGDDDDDDGDD
ncbi:hypothetical protein [Herbidospora cretacea]|uniref:hypothetical protein n=1 Tax=Herbidospora cretacea TaxID=28444 RepID=UPI000AFDE14B|nr:hypothetical protein [Herbidospora cretacea]